ncbi:arylsulfatase [Pedobacter sp. SYP-B3415]|uniref:arylsulfatase n=1 Tax=Pedobacter sp. SYP-B3415 TaxID=2496641 RepID=UPI00101CE4FA|nr:arylsulfatase [Pedobacter sp. SYP-B3415]
MKNLTLLILILLFATAVPVAAQQGKKPNIIFILADDLGYGNLTSYQSDSKTPTPNIDRLAKEGLKFTRFYSGNTVCAPSRCALMTGKHMGNAWVRGNAKAKDGLAALRPQDTTLSQRLKAAGYATGMYGKWGLGDEDSQGAPHLKGFDSFFGYLDQSHAHDYFTKRLYETANGKTFKVQVDSASYAQDLIMNKALQFIGDHRDEPFFLYLPLTLPHAELRVTDSLMKRFRNADGSSKFPPETPFEKKNNYDSQAQPHAAFAAMIHRLDADVGRVLEQVKKLGLDDNTYIFFSSDNGPHAEGGADPEFFNSAGGLRGIKRDLYEGGIRVPMLVRAPGKIAAGKVTNQPWAFWDVLPTFTRLVGTTTPADIDGLPFNAVLQGRPAEKTHDYLYWQFNEKGLKEAITQGPWKLIRFKQQGEPERFELYNIQQDRAEARNLAAQEREKVTALRKLMLAAKTPAENPRFRWDDVEK